MYFMEERNMPQMHKYGERTNNSSYEGNHMSHHFWSGTYKISGTLIVVGQSVQLKVHELNA
jgi:hypothetical protein